MKLALSAAIALALAAATPAHADEAALQAEVQELRAQLLELKAQVDELRGAKTTAPAPAPAPAMAQVQAPVSTQQARTEAPLPAPSDTTLFGYGELNYNHPTGDSSATEADLRRAVLGFSHRFDDRTRVYGEFEWEHAVTSADDAGEAAVEQLAIEHTINSNLGVRAGLVLIPLGFLNERHEPPTYYGVERNFVETAIIPTTWREGAVALYGSTDGGWNWNLGVSTGFDLSKWDASSSEGLESPLASIHQELQFAKARDLSVYASANWQGVPGLTVGGGVFAGGAGQSTPDFPAEDAKVVLGEAHVRYQNGLFDLSALYARGHISDTEDLNLTFVGQPTPIPEEFWGAYVEGAWHAWESGGSSLAPFLRYEAFNTASSYAPVPLGLGVPEAETEHVWTVGANYWLNPSVVFKLDYQTFDVADADRFDVGLGFMF